MNNEFYAICFNRIINSADLDPDGNITFEEAKEIVYDLFGLVDVNDFVQFGCDFSQIVGFLEDGRIVILN